MTSEFHPIPLPFLYCYLVSLLAFVFFTHVAHPRLVRKYAEKAATEQAEIVRTEARRLWLELTRNIATELLQVPSTPLPQGQPNADSAVPPQYLYHATPRANLPSLLASGLEGRRGESGMVFMAQDEIIARLLGKECDCVVLRVLAQRAYENGVVFEEWGSRYFVTTEVHPAFIDFHWAMENLAERGINLSS